MAQAFQLGRNSCQNLGNAATLLLKNPVLNFFFRKILVVVDKMSFNIENLCPLKLFVSNCMGLAAP